jgi:acetyl-CoA carboxylase carboxyltransferase component
VGRDNPRDRRLIALAEVRDLTPTRDASGRVSALPELENVLIHCTEDIRRWQVRQPAEELSQWNRIVLYVWPLVDTPLDELLGVVNTLAPVTQGIGLEEVVIQARVPQAPTGAPREIVLHVANPTGTGVTTRLADPPTEPLQPLDEYTQKVLQSRRRGNVYPYELASLLVRADEHSAATGAGTFTEYDLHEEALAAVARPPGRNTAAIVVGVVRTPTIRYPEGMTRIALLGDPTKALGSIAEPECRRIIAAIDLAEAMGVPVEWFAVSAGATVAMDSGTENLDWVARVLRRIVEFTQAGGEVNVVVTGVNVGGQSYWNAEAAMLMHARGILVMTPDSSMVLTGKQALEFAGAVAAEDNAGIGGYERIMGPNGEAQYWAPDVAAACHLLLAHYEHTYRAPGERFPRRAVTSDAPTRDVCASPHSVSDLDFRRVGEIFSDATNPGRKKPFDIRSVMRAVIDEDHPPLERWAAMRDAETAVVLDARLDGHPVCLVGIESRPLQRYGLIPADGPEQWTAGTLFPLSSKKVARAINAASGIRPVVVLANLSGFDGSPESMRKLQLEYGAEIGRAIVNFDGPIVFCAISRYHGGAFVVFSRTLNDHMEVAALEGSYASVIGGTAAAGVVFTGEVTARTRADPRVRTLETRVGTAEGAELAQLRTQLAEVTAAVRFEKLGEVGAEFDAVHSVERALEFGSVDRIIRPTELRPYLIDAVERGRRRVLEEGVQPRTVPMPRSTTP